MIQSWQEAEEGGCVSARLFFYSALRFRGWESWGERFPHLTPEKVLETLPGLGGGGVFFLFFFFFSFLVFRFASPVSARRRVRATPSPPEPTEATEATEASAGEAPAGPRRSKDPELAWAPRNEAVLRPARAGF